VKIKITTCGCGEGCLHSVHSLVAAGRFGSRKSASPECPSASRSSHRKSRCHVTASTERENVTVRVQLTYFGVVILMNEL